MIYTVMFLFVLGALLAIVGVDLWFRGEVRKYKGLYLKVSEEKKNLMVDYGQRLDEIKRRVGGDSGVTYYLSTDSVSGNMEPLRACESTSDNLDEYF